VKSKAVAAWLVVVVACSLIARFDDGWLASYLSLQPRKVMHGEVWRLVTWPAIELGLISGFFTVRWIYSLGDDLAVAWGNARLFRYLLAITLAGGTAYVLAAAATGDATLWRCGGGATMSALAIAWSRVRPDNTLTYFRSIALRGLGVVAAMVGFAVVDALLRGPVEALPELVACALAIVWPHRNGMVS